MAISTSRRYRFAPELLVERFGEEALLLVAGRDLLLTVNVAAADLFEAATGAFARGDFSAGEIAAWLAGQYRLPAAAGRRKSRELLAFGLRHHLVDRADAAAAKQNRGDS